MVNQQLLVRACPTCVKCGHMKDEGLLLCWPCHHAEKRRNDGAYSKQTERKIAALELKLERKRMWKVEVITSNGNGQWYSNGMRFGSREGAEFYAKDLFSRWTAVREWRVVQEEEETK